MHRIMVDGMPWETSVLIKALYFVEALGSSTWGRFGTIYYNLHHLTSFQIGWLEGLMTMVPIVFLPFWGMISDTMASRKVVYATTKAISTVLLLLLSTPFIYQSYIRIVCISLCTKIFVSEGLLDSYTLELLGQKNKRLYGKYRLYASLSWGMGAIVMGYSTDHYGFEPNFILYGLLGFLCLGLIVWKIPGQKAPFGTNAHHRYDQDHPSTDDEDPRGHSLITSHDRTTQQEQQHDQQPEYHRVASEVGLAPDGQDRNVIQQDQPLEQEYHHDQPHQQQEQQGNTIWDLFLLSCRPRVTLFLLEVIVMGAGMATVERLLFLYMVNDLQSSTFLCGLSVGVNVIFEIPIFWYATDIVGYLGLDGMQLLSMICFAVRVFGYTLLTPSTKYWILPLEIFHGITFACFWVVATDVTKSLIIIMPYWSTTIPCVVQTLYAAIGVGFGSVFGGWAMQQWGSRTMYHCMATLIACMLIFHSIGSLMVRVLKGSNQSFLPDYTTMMDSTGRVLEGLDSRHDGHTEEVSASHETPNGTSNEFAGTRLCQEEEFAALLSVEQQQEQRL